jgi:hypothetical protein
MVFRIQLSTARVQTLDPLRPVPDMVVRQGRRRGARLAKCPDCDKQASGGTCRRPRHDGLTEAGQKWEESVASFSGAQRRTCGGHATVEL